MKVEAEILISAGRVEVWNTIANIEQLQYVLTTVEKIELLTVPEANLVGERWRETRRYFGKPATIEKCVTDARKYACYTTSAQLDGFVFLTTFILEDSSNGTIVKSIHETSAENFMAGIKLIPMLVFKGILRKAIMKDLTEIKYSIEQCRPS